MINAEDFWTAAAKRLAFRRNVASWSDLFLPLMGVISGFTAISLLLVRILGLNTPFLWQAWSGAMAAAAIFVAATVWRQPFTFGEALARLDEVAHLRNRLVSAHAGVGPWPAPQSGVRDAVRWNWPRLALPVFAAALLLAAVSLVKPSAGKGNGRPSTEPVAWSQVGSWLQALDQTKLADPQALQKLQDQLNDLRHQPAEDWYNQDSLEAGDALRQQMEKGMRDMQTALQQGSDVIGAAGQPSAQMSSPELKALSASLQQSLQGLQGGNLPANSELLAKLQNFNPANPRQMTPEQLRQLQEQMQKGLKTCALCVGPRITQGHGPGTHGRANGGKGGGGETAPLDLSDEATDLHTKRLEADPNEDMSRALPGDVLTVTKGKHQVDKSAAIPTTAGGAISSTGEGGEAVWRDSVTPDEQLVLQRYFK